MADAKRCDRCGKCFDPYHMDGDACQFRNPVFTNSESLKEMKRAGLLYEDAGPDTWVDLCPTCSIAFVIFMNGGELEKKDGEKDFAKIVHEQKGADISVELGKCGKQLRDCVNGVFSRVSELMYGKEDKTDE